MKKLLLLLFLAVTSTGLFAQNDQGEITYEMVIHIKIDKSKLPPEALSFVEAMPKEIRQGKRLLFNKDASLYQDYEDPENADVEMETDGMKMMMRRNMPEEYVYVDLEEKRLAEKKEVFGRLFLVKDELKPYAWKMTGEQEEIAGYPCMKATAMDPVDSTEITAWFTPSIPVPTGPSGINSLPGMVLKIESSGGSFRRGPGGNSTVEVTASNVNFRKVKKNEMKEPTKGKEVTREEFKEIMTEKMKEMREQYRQGGGGHHRMMVH